MGVVFGRLAGCVLCVLATGSGAQQESASSLSEAVQNGTLSLDLRYRYEWVDQDNKPENAKASLLRSRLTLTSAPLNGFTAAVEFDDVSAIGPDDYNSTENGKTEFPVVADPEYTEINQLWLGYRDGDLGVKGGRQRINHLNQRFLGGVAWRNNEQTFDSLRVEWSPMARLDLDLSYASRVNRIFGPDDGANPSELKGDNLFGLAQYRLAKGHKISGFAYLLDFDAQEGFAAGKTVNNASDTFGVEYSGKLDDLKLRASYATQSDAGDSLLDYRANYYLLEAGTGLGPVQVQVAYEVLASDNGVGFATPLATAHKFQGWADLFLATPGDGIEDLNLSIGGKIGPVTAKAIYHDFKAEAGGADFGTELDLIANWPVNKQVFLQAKYANFSSDNPARFPDTVRAWLTVQFKLP